MPRDLRHTCYNLRFRFIIQPGGTMFSDHSSLLYDNPSQRNYGVAVTDVDDDGAFEIVVAGFGHPNLVLKWDGTYFRNIATSMIADAERQAISIAACDIDG